VFKTVSDLAAKTGLARKRVLEEGRKLYLKGAVLQDKKDGEVAYGKIDHFHAHKREILSFVDNPKKLAKLATKRRPAVTVSLPKSITIPAGRAMAYPITIDDVQSFAKVRKVRKAGSLPDTLSENAFKNGIKAIIGEKGTFKDWGGEKSDLFTTQLRVKGKRRMAAFAFKGPGEKRKLTPALMGKNGDQGLRLFHEPAEVYFVQHWRDIDSAVIELLREIARGKSAYDGGAPIWYGVIDGHDSERLRLAYPSAFASNKGRKSVKRRAHK
jgi:hypothetical protein